MAHGPAALGEANDSPPCAAVYQQMRRWLEAGYFEALVASPSRAPLGSTTGRSSSRQGREPARPLGHLLPLNGTAADQCDRTQVVALAEEVQQMTGKSVELADVDQGYTGQNAADAAEQYGIRLEVVKRPMAKRGFVLPPRRWIVEHSPRLGRPLLPLGPRLRTAPGGTQRTPISSPSPSS
jgi:hypothetical protein